MEVKVTQMAVEFEVEVRSEDGALQRCFKLTEEEAIELHIVLAEEFGSCSDDGCPCFASGYNTNSNERPHSIGS